MRIQKHQVTRIKLGRGHYVVGGIEVVKKFPTPCGIGTVSTWVEVGTGKMVGYTLADVGEVGRARINKVLADTERRLAQSRRAA